MKKKIKISLLKVCIPIVIIGGCLSIGVLVTHQSDKSKEKSQVVCKDSSELVFKDNKPLQVISKKQYGNIEGISKNFGFSDNNEIVVGIGLSADEYKNKYNRELNNSDGNEPNYDRAGYVFKLNLSSLEKKPLNIRTYNVKAITQNVESELDYYKDGKLNIYDLKGDINTVYGQYHDNILSDTSPSKTYYGDYGEWSKDGNVLIKYLRAETKFKIYNIKAGTEKEVKLPSTDYDVNDSNLYSQDGKDIYFNATKRQDKDGQSVEMGVGIYKINSENAELDTMLFFPVKGPKDTNNYNLSHYSVLDNGKKIILYSLKEGTGISIYDVMSKKFYNPNSSSKKSKNVKYNYFSVSPDETKVILCEDSNGSKNEECNIYGLKINGNSFSDRICLCKNVAFTNYADIKWSNDSKSIEFFSCKDFYEIRNAERKYPGKSQINLITFK